MVWGVGVSHDGTRIVSASHDETIRFWDTMTGEQLRQFKGHTSTIYKASVTKDGKLLATASVSEGSEPCWRYKQDHFVRLFHGDREEEAGKGEGRKVGGISLILMSPGLAS